MKITVHTAMTPWMVDPNIDAEIIGNQIRSEMAIKFSQELVKNIGIITYEKRDNEVVYEMQAIVIKMESFHRLVDFFRELGLSADRMERLRKMFIEEL